MKNLLICMASLFFVYTAMAKKNITIVVPFAELGYPKIQLTMWPGLSLPRQTPKPIMHNPIVALQRTVTDPKFQDKMSRLGGSAAHKNYATSDHLRKNLEFEAKRWTPLITRYREQ